MFFFWLELFLEFLKRCNLVFEDDEEENISFKRIVFFFDFYVKVELYEYVEKDCY